MVGTASNLALAKEKEKRMRKASFLIYCAIDDRYVVPYLVSMYSALKNSNLANRELRFHLVFESSTLSRESINLLTGVAETLSADFRVICLDELEEIKSIGHYPGLVFAKFLIPEMISEDFVWIDADTLLLEGWDEVLHFEPTQSSMAISGVQDFWVLANHDKLRQNQSVNRALHGGTPYVNAGVLQVRSLIWRSRYRDKWRAATAKAELSGFSMADQDVLNYLVSGDVGMLAPNLNRIIDPRSRSELEAGIWHFAGGWKPWERATQLRFLGRRTGQLWVHYATRLSHHLLASDADLAHVFITRWQSLQSTEPNNHSLRFPKNLIYWLLDKLVKDPSRISK